MPRVIGQSPRRAVPHPRGLLPLLHEIRDADLARLRQNRESCRRISSERYARLTPIFFASVSWVMARDSRICLGSTADLSVTYCYLKSNK